MQDSRQQQQTFDWNNAVIVVSVCWTIFYRKYLAPNAIKQIADDILVDAVALLW